MIFNFTLPPFPDLSFKVPEIEIPEINIPFEISTDSNFSQDSTKFASNQTIYVRVTNPNTNPAEVHILNLHDSSYKTLQTYNLAQNGNTYCTNLQAPTEGGTYSLEVRLVTNGSTNSFVRTIQVGEGGSSSNVKISQVEGSNSNNVSQSPTPNPSAEPSPSQTPASGTQEPQVLGNTMGNVFVRLWLSIQNFWDNFWH